MKAKVLWLLAAFLLATCFGDEAKEQEKPVDPLDAEITDIVENEPKPSLEFIDFIPFHPKKTKERWFNIVITIGNNRPGDSPFGFNENPVFEPAMRPRETAQDNTEWMKNTILYITIAIAFVLFLSTVSLLVTLRYYQKKPAVVASKPSSGAGASSRPPSAGTKARLYPCRLSQANVKLIASMMREDKPSDLDKLV